VICCCNFVENCKISRAWCCEGRVRLNGSSRFVVGCFVGCDPGGEQGYQFDWEQLVRFSSAESGVMVSMIRHES
jgi:hypothetical protein